MLSNKYNEAGPPSQLNSELCDREPCVKRAVGNAGELRVRPLMLRDRALSDFLGRLALRLRGEKAQGFRMTEMRSH